MPVEWTPAMNCPSNRASREASAPYISSKLKPLMPSSVTAAADIP
jgi:hypothetical protein